MPETHGLGKNWLKANISSRRYPVERAWVAHLPTTPTTTASCGSLRMVFECDVLSDAMVIVSQHSRGHRKGAWALDKGMSSGRDARGSDEQGVQSRRVLACLQVIGGNGGLARTVHPVAGGVYLDRLEGTAQVVDGQARH